MEKARAINQYVCEVCGHRTTTVNQVDGTTPFMTRCTAIGCEGWASSSFYRVPQDLRPTHEWYRPDEAELATLDEEVRDYVGRGCLLIRKLDVMGLERYGFRSRFA